MMVDATTFVEFNDVLVMVEALRLLKFPEEANKFEE